MNIALCASFLEEDIWESRLQEAALPYNVEIIQCNSAKRLLQVLELKQFSLLAVVLNGVIGLETVRQLREYAPDVPLLWISDDDFSLFGYKHHVTYFLRRPVVNDELRDAVLSCLRE